MGEKRENTRLHRETTENEDFFWAKQGRTLAYTGKLRRRKISIGRNKGEHSLTRGNYGEGRFLLGEKRGRHLGAISKCNSSHFWMRIHRTTRLPCMLMRCSRLSPIITDSRFFEFCVVYSCHMRSPVRGADRENKQHQQPGKHAR